MKNIKVLIITAILLSPSVAHAVRVTSPLAIDNGNITCTNCSTAAGTLTADAVVIGGGTKAISTVTSNGTGTKMYLSQTSGATPAWAQVAIGDLAAFNSAALLAVVSDETGSGTGTPLLVFNQNPTIAGVTGTGTWNLSGGTVSLPADAVDAITEIATAIKSGNGSKLGTVTGTLTTGKQLAFDADGNIIASGSDIGGTAINPRITVHSQTPVTATNAAPVYMSFGGAVSTTEADVRHPFPNATVLGAVSCIAVSGTGQAIVVTVGENACTAAADFTGTKLNQTMSATAMTVAADADSTTIGANECGTIRLQPASGSATQTDIVCTFEVTG